jgi:hypothetical protein
MGGEKAALVLGLLELGYEVLLSDSDTVWMRDPWPYLRAVSDVDIMVSSDCPSLYGDRTGAPRAYHSTRVRAAVLPLPPFRGSQAAETEGGGCAGRRLRWAKASTLALHAFRG